MGAWIETDLRNLQHFSAPSLPIWERGLKPQAFDFFLLPLKSLPIWERGLKHIVQLLAHPV